MGRLLQTLLAMVTGAIAALLWVERQTSSRPSAPPPRRPPPEPERVIEQVVVPDPEQAAKIEALEAELRQQRALRVAAPDEPPPSVDALRAARARAYELERRLSQPSPDSPPRWSDIDPPLSADLLDATVAHLPRVALWSMPEVADETALWTALGAMQEFAEACEGDWFEFHGDFARWCSESGHPAALDDERCDTDGSHPTFAVDPKVNRSGRMVAPTYVQVGAQRLYYVDDVAGETGRMHIVGASPQA